MVKVDVDEGRVGKKVIEIPFPPVMFSPLPGDDMRHHAYRKRGIL